MWTYYGNLPGFTKYVVADKWTGLNNLPRGTGLHQKEAGHGYIPLMLWLISETMLVIESRRTTQEYSSAKMWTSKSINIPNPSRKLQVLDCVLGFLLFGTQFTFRQRLQLALANRSENISHLREFMDTLLLQWNGRFCALSTKLTSILTYFACRFQPIGEAYYTPILRNWLVTSRVKATVMVL